MSIYGAVTGKSFDEIEAEFAGKGYGDFKVAVGDGLFTHARLDGGFRAAFRHSKR